MGEICVVMVAGWHVGKMAFNWPLTAPLRTPFSKYSKLYLEAGLPLSLSLSLTHTQPKLCMLFWINSLGMNWKALGDSILM